MRLLNRMNMAHSPLGILRTRKFGIPLLCFLLVIIAVIVYLVVFQESPASELVEREIARLEREVEQNPDNLDKRVELALLYSEAGLHQQAIKQLKTTLESDESHTGALMALGDIYMWLGRYQEALEPYNKVVELNKDNPMRHVNRQLEAVYYHLGVAYFNMGRPEDATQSLKEALTIDRTDADAWYMLGSVYQHSKDYQNAIESFEQAVRFIPDFKEAYQGLAACYEKTGQTNLASYAKAMVSYSSGLSDKAISQLEKVVAVMPDFPEAYLGLGLAYEKEGEISKAIDAYEHALRLNPDLWLAQAKMATLSSREK